MIIYTYMILNRSSNVCLIRHAHMLVFTIVYLRSTSDYIIKAQTYNINKVDRLIGAINLKSKYNISTLIYMT